MGDQALMDEVTAEIKAVCVKLEEVEAEIKQAQAEHNNEEVAALRKEKEQLRKEKLLLLQRQSGAMSSCVPRVHALTCVCLLADVHGAGSSNAGSERGSPPGALSAFGPGSWGLHVFSYAGAEKENAGTLAQAMGLGTALHADAPGVCTARARAL